MTHGDLVITKAFHYWWNWKRSSWSVIVFYPDHRHILWRETIPYSKLEPFVKNRRRERVTVARRTCRGGPSSQPRQVHYPSDWLLYTGRLARIREVRLLVHRLGMYIYFCLFGCIITFRTNITCVWLSTPKRVLEKSE
jgi:hypothetical protein